MSEMTQPTGQLEYRTATMAALSYPKRTIELVVMPYETPTVADYHGRMIREIVTRGAFDGIDQRPNRVKLNRDHDVTRTCGHAVRFHPSRTEGLVAEVKVSRTPLGEETLELANDGDLGASAGFLPMRRTDGTLEEVWEERDFRRLNKVWLGHIAMTPIPAYPGAEVLTVRQQPPAAAPGLGEPPAGIVVATPNLDRVRALVLEARYPQPSR
jgi:HK97 family phage prohead protease